MASTALPASGASKQRPRRWIGLLPLYVICAAVTLAVLVPIFTAVVGGFKTTAQLYADPFGWPQPLVTTNYTGILASGAFWRQLLNSVIVMALTTALVLLLASMAAFVFARINFRGREVLFNIFTIGLLFPLAVAILPLYILLRQLHLLDSLVGIALAQVAFGLPGNIMLLRGFFRAIPGELEDAAHIDGCTSAGFFWRILLPIARPALATVAVTTMVASWNAFLLPLLVLTSPELMTLPLGIMQFQGQFGSDWARIMAFITLTMLPALIFYLFAERHLVAGLSAGAIKG
jgi:raffinose/stachyose/melibiose transport system permease protein